MPDRSAYIWLFFRFTGRVNRAAYVLGLLLMMVVMAFPLYQFMRVPPESGSAQLWSILFWLAFLVFLWAHVAFSVKRLHDFDKPGMYAVALFIPIVSIIAFLALCFYPGTPGPNQYGQRTNSPQ